ncbi:MAG: restriction endonuclease subunit S [Atopobiaceae bacterium]
MKAKDLRNSILQLAVEGRLVPQDATEEPASELIARIRDERRRLVAAGKAKAPKGGESVICRGEGDSWYERRGKGEPRCIDSEIPFDIPEGWEWARLGSLCSKIGSGSTPSGGRNSYVDEGPMLLRSQNVHDEGLRLDGVARFAYKLYEGRGSHVEPNDVLLNITGASIGRCAVAPASIGEADVNQHVLILRQVSMSLTSYIHMAIVSPVVQGKIMSAQVGATKEGLSATKAKALLVPLPPLAEQQRIVARVDELMPLVGEYGRLGEERERLDSELPGRLRKSVLQLAVEGRLVPQDAAEEPASELMARIRDERRRLVAAGKAKAPKGGESVIYRGEGDSWYERRGRGEPRCIDGEIPFDIPEGWEWARLNCLFVLQAGKNIEAQDISATRDATHQYPCYGGNGIRGFVGIANRKDPCPIIGRQGALCGNINYAEGEFYATEHAVTVTLFAGVDVSWSCLVLTALRLNQYATATAQPGLAVSKISEVLAPLPPLAEQRRIVAKVDELMPLIGEYGRLEEDHVSDQEC